MNVSPDISELKTKVATLEADTRNLIDWQKDQNGALVRLVEKVDKLQFWIMTQTVTLLGALGIGVLTFLLKK